METITYTDKDSAIADLKSKFTVPRDHYNKHAFQKTREFSILRFFLETDDPIIQYPITITYCGEKSHFPDFTVRLNNADYLIEVTQITNHESQDILQNRKPTKESEVTGSVDLTPDVKMRVDVKNNKLPYYKEKTSLQNSILLLYHNQWPLFSLGAFGDEFRPEEVRSHFNHTFILNILCNGFNYMKL